MIGRRVNSMAEIERPGDYFYDPHRLHAVDPTTKEPIEYRPSILFLLPNARDEGAVGGQRVIHKVCEPPHVFRHCDDGSIEVRESIGAMPFWHGYLDEGHVWREV